MRVKYLFSALVILLALSGITFSQEQTENVEWEALAEILVNSKGLAVDQTAAQSKVILLDFWASWCGPCRQSFPWMNEMKAKYAEQGLSIIAINLDAEKEDAQEFLSDVRAEFSIAFDQEGISAEMLGVEAMPMSYLINANGEILHRVAGFNTSKKAVHEAHIRESLGLK